MRKFFISLLLVLSLTTMFAEAKRVIGKVNGIPIYEQEANKLLKVLTKGKVKYSQLKPKDKREIVRRLAIDKLVIKKAYRGLTKQERDFVIANAWLAKKTRNVKVSNAEIKKVYRQNKHLFKKNGKILPYSKVKNIIKMQLKQKKVIDRMMKKAKIVVK
jgi:galactokinase/mevalonate kinase-like predicted kinase